MKAITTITLIFAAGLLFAQDKNKVTLKPAAQHHTKPLLIKERKSMAPVDIAPAIEPSKSIAGHYYVAKYSVLSLMSHSPEVLDRLVGSEVVVTASRISGPEVKMDPFDIVSKKLMSSSDYIYEVFGRSVRSPEPNLPQEVKVLKTTGSDLYGIIDLPGDRIAIPYKGLLLILEQGR